MGQRTGHQVQGDLDAKAILGRAESIGEILEQRPPRQRSDGIHPLGEIKPESRALTPSNNDRAHSSRRQGLQPGGPGISRPPGRSRSVATDRGWRNRAGRQRGKIDFLIVARDQPGDQFQVQRRELSEQLLPLPRVQFIPVLEDMGLAERLQTFDQGGRGIVGHD